MNTKILTVSLPVVALLAACSNEKARAPRPATPVRVVAAEAAPQNHGHRYSATLQARSQVSVSFRSSGYVQAIRNVSGSTVTARLLQAGDRVVRGAELAHVKQQDTAAKVAQAQASLAEAKASAEKARLDAARAEKLYEARSLTRPELDAARAGTRVGEARVAAAEAQLAAAVVAHDDTRLIAPLSGVVVSRAIEEGTLVSPGTPAFVLADTDGMKAVFGVPDVVVQKLRIGTPIPIVAEAVPGVAFEGVVTAIAPSADATSRVFDVEVSVPNGDGRLKIGMVAAVEVKDAAATPAAPTPSVPLSAVLKSPRGTGYAVFVVDGRGPNSVVRARDVTLGAISGNLVSVLDGIGRGDSVVVTGAALLADGEAVRVIP